MRKVCSFVLTLTLTLMTLASVFTTCGIKTKAASNYNPPNKYWDYKTEKAVVSVYDKYSSDQAAFKTKEWKILDEVQLFTIALSPTKVDIKLDRSFGSGDVLLGMNTINKELAFAAFQNMTFNGQQSPYLQMERLDFYKALNSSLIIVRCDPCSKTVSNVSRYGTGNKTGFVYFVDTPKQDWKITIKDNATMDKVQKVRTQYLWTKTRRAGSNISDLYIEGYYAREITGAPDAKSYMATITVTTSEKTTGTKTYTISHVYIKDSAAYKKGQYKKTYGFAKVEYYFENKRLEVYNFSK